MKYIIFLLFFIAFTPRVSSAQERDTSGYTSQENKPIDQSPQSMVTLDCQELPDLADSYFQSENYKKAYDTIRYGLENCSNVKDYWRNFSIARTSVQYMSDDNQRFVDFREWLKKVLYYNTTDSNWWCADVDALMNTFIYFEGRGWDFLGSLAVINYIKESGRCRNWYSQSVLDEMYSEGMKYAYEAWRDSVKDSIATPFDSTLPTLEELNLGILRGPNEAVGRTHDYRFGELIAVRNPFNDVLDLKYRLIKNGLVKVDVLDILGRSIYSEGQGYKPEGEHTLSIQTNNLSSGTYYVRLSTPSGEIKTVKLIKE
jgi:hypothetical protein